MTQDEFLEALEELNGEAYTLQLKEPMSAAQAQAIRKDWHKIGELTGKPKPLLILPHTMQLHNIGKGSFNFSIALMLLDLGYCIAREKWTQGYIFKENGIIRQSHDGKEWIPTQGALKGIDWRVIKRG